ncbi:MAG: TlpA disulfide reductase family protein [Opitutaceae bacterium]
MSRPTNQPIQCLALAALLGLFPAAAFAGVKVGDAFPALDAAGLSGGELPATSGKIVLVDFCASWCAPCKASFPAYAKLYADYAPKGLIIVAVSVDQDQAAYQAFVKKLKPPFVTLRDAKQQLVNEVNVPTMPTCYLLGTDGRVRFVHEGYHGEESEQEIRKEIDTLLTEKTNPS